LQSAFKQNHAQLPKYNVFNPKGRLRRSKYQSGNGLVMQWNRPSLLSSYLQADSKTQTGPH